MLQCDGDGQGEAVHEAADGRSFFGHGDEKFSGRAIGIEADGDVALVVSHFKFVGDGGALFLQLVADGARRSVEIFFLNVWRGHSCPRVLFAGVRSLSPCSRQRLRLLAAIAINCHCLQPQLPRLKISLHDVFNRGILGKIDGLRYSSGDKRLSSRHHAQMSHVGDGARAFCRLERAIKHGEMLVFDVRRALDRASRIDVADDGIRLIVVVTKFEQRSRHSVVDDLNHASADQLLVFDQSQIRLNSCGIAVHHEADGACWG